MVEHDHNEMWIEHSVLAATIIRRAPGQVACRPFPPEWRPTKRCLASSAIDYGHMTLARGSEQRLHTLVEHPNEFARKQCDEEPGGHNCSSSQDCIGRYVRGGDPDDEHSNRE
jgi:hypothetical protein